MDGDRMTACDTCKRSVLKCDACDECLGCGGEPTGAEVLAIEASVARGFNSQKSLRMGNAQNGATF